MKKIISGFIFLLILIAFSRLFLEKNFKYPFEIVQQSEIKFTMPQYGILDLLGIIFGQRRLGSDIAWIQVLQYYGTFEDGEVEHKHKAEHEHLPAYLYGGGKYYDFLKYCQRIVWLDPFFHFTYLYGSASLAWNIGRDEEALELLNTGIESYRRWRLLSPESEAVLFSKELKFSEYWQLEAYKLAIVYKKLDKYKEMIDKLEEVVKIPGAPVTIKVILANIHKHAGKYKRALELWIEIYESGPNDYTSHAEKEITYIRSLLGI